MLGNYLHVQNQPGAEETILRAIEMNPNNVDTLALYAGVLRSESRFEDSLPIIDRALELDPLSVTLCHERGRALVLLGRTEEALAALQGLVDDRWGMNWRWHTEFNPDLASLKGDLQYPAIANSIEADIQAQLAANSVS